MKIEDEDLCIFQETLVIEPNHMKRALANTIKILVKVSTDELVNLYILPKDIEYDSLDESDKEKLANLIMADDGKLMKEHLSSIEDQINNSSELNNHISSLERKSVLNYLKCCKHIYLEKLLLNEFKDNLQNIIIFNGVVEDNESTLLVEKLILLSRALPKFFIYKENIKKKGKMKISDFETNAYEYYMDKKDELMFDASLYGFLVNEKELRVAQRTNEDSIDYKVFKLETDEATPENAIYKALSSIFVGELFKGINKDISKETAFRLGGMQKRCL